MRTRFGTFQKTVALALTLAIGISAAGAPAALADTPRGPLVITAENLDEVLFTGNMDVVRAMSTMLRAKEQVSLARAGLLPSLNLNFNAVTSFVAAPLFMINSASCLVPFLFPSAWFELRAANRAYSAEKMAFHITKLNVYATAYALASRVAADEAILDIMNAQFSRVSEYVHGLQVQYDVGLIPHAEVLRGEMELGRMRAELGKLRDAVTTEKATLRKAFGLPLTQDFIVAVGDVAPSRLENLSAVSALEPVLLRAPERRQIDLLIAAARAQVRQAEWAFLAGCSGSQGGVSTGGTGAFSLSNGALVSIGFGYFPKVRIAKANVRDLETRHGELRLELGRQLETTLSSIRELNARTAQSVRDVELAEQMLTEQQHLFELGRSSVKDILDTYTAISRAKVEAVSISSALASHRITLRRIGLEDRFLKVLIDSRRELEIGNR
jgi:outer membrane protein TolC